MIFFTSINYNYISKAIVLANSVKTIYPDSKFIVMLTEREVDKNIIIPSSIDSIILTKDIGFEDYEKFIFRFSVVEACTAVKGQSFSYLFTTYESENTFIYLDPDIYLYSKMDELEKMLQRKEIVLTPHLTDPEIKDNFQQTVEAVMDNELSALKHGAYNLGFLGLKRGNESQKFIEWWKSRLNMFCYSDIPNGIFTDQKWCDLAPCFFNVGILKHPGYNVAPWNISNRDVNYKDMAYYANGLPIRCFHFSGFDSGANEAMILKYSKTKDIIKLRDKYVKLLEIASKKSNGNVPWSYNYYLSGEKINSEIRLEYRTNPILQEKIYDPFLESNNSINNLLLSV